MTVLDLDAFSLKHIIWWEARGHASLASTLNPAPISSVLVCFTVSFLNRRQRGRLHASAIGPVHLFVYLSVCLSVAKSETPFSQKLSNLEPLCLLTTYRKSTWAFQRKIQGG